MNNWRNQWMNVSWWVNEWTDGWEKVNGGWSWIIIGIVVDRGCGGLSSYLSSGRSPAGPQRNAAHGEFGKFGWESEEGLFGVRGGSVRCPTKSVWHRTDPPRAPNRPSSDSLPNLAHLPCVPIGWGRDISSILSIFSWFLGFFKNPEQN